MARSGFRENRIAISSCSKWHLARLLIGLRMGMHLFHISRVGVNPRTIVASRRIAWKLGICSILIATLVCWPHGNRFALAKNDASAPTLHFRIDKLEVEAKEANEPP
jgi:hypothetical protein